MDGILGIPAGIVAFVWPGITAFALLFLIAAWAIVSGMMHIVGAFVLPLGARLASVIFGVLIAVWPAAGLLTVIWLISNSG